MLYVDCLSPLSLHNCGVLILLMPSTSSDYFAHYFSYLYLPWRPLIWFQTPVLVPPLPSASDPLLRPLQPAQVLRVHDGLPHPPPQQPQHHQQQQPHDGHPHLQLRGA